MSRRPEKKRGERGTTLIEVLIAGLITTIVAGATMEFYVSQHKNWLMQTEVSDVQQCARACLDEMAGELRMGGYGLDTHAAFAIGSDSLAVYYQGDSAGVVDTVLYFVDSYDPDHPMFFRQKQNGTPELYAEDIEALTVTALSARVLELLITARGPKPDAEFIGGDGYRRRTYSTRVTLRNR